MAFDMEANKAKIIELWGQVKRPGVERFVKWLCSTDFFIAPASTRFHGAYQGGLAEHSRDVFERMLQECAAEQSFVRAQDINRPKDYVDDISMENIIVTALGHDICKAEFYKWDMKNQKQPDGSWAQVPFITVEDQLPYGHGEKSVYILQSFFRLTRAEAMAIRFHMGDYAGDKNTSRAHEMFPLAALLHIADLKATYLTDRRTPPVLENSGEEGNQV